MPTTIRKLVAYINVFFCDNLIPHKNHYFNFIFIIVNVNVGNIYLDLLKPFKAKYQNSAKLIIILCDNHNHVSITFYLAGHSIMTVIVTSKVIATRVKNIVAKRMDRKDPNAASNHDQHKGETNLESVINKNKHFQQVLFDF